MRHHGLHLGLDQIVDQAARCDSGDHQVADLPRDLRPELGGEIGVVVDEVRVGDQGSRAEVEIVGKDKASVKVEKSAVPLLIGRGGSTINELERMLGIRIDVEPKLKSLGSDVHFDINEAGNSVNILFDDETIGNSVDVYIDNDYLFSAVVGKKARIKVSKKADAGKKIIKAMMTGTPVRVLTQAR